MREAGWLVLVYRVPTDPASKRIAVWRDLKRLGALYLQQCVCIVPRRATLVADLERIAAKIPDAGGEFTVLEVPALRPADEARIVDAFRVQRDKEYAEIIEECETKFVKEVEFEHFRQNYTYEEAEEIAQDLDKIQRWFRRVRERDWFGAGRRGAVEAWIARCQALLDAFEQEVYRQAGDDAVEPIAGTPHLPAARLAPVPRRPSGPASHDSDEGVEMEGETGS